MAIQALRSATPIAVLLILCMSGNLKAQVLPAQDTLQKDSIITPVKVKNSDNFIAERIGDDDIQYFKGNVRMFHDSVYMFSDSAIIKNNQLTAVGEVLIIQEDTINIFSDSLMYNADTKLAELHDNVVLESSDKQLFTNFMIYNLANKQGTFTDTAILRKETMTLSSIKGIYNMDTKRALFYEQVVIIDEDFRLTCDSLDYDTDVDRAYFRSPTYIFQGEKRIYCEDGYYDIEEGRAYFTKNAIIQEKDQVASADDILVSEIDSTLTLEGNALVKDSVSVAKGDKIIFNDRTGEIEIYGDGSYESEGNLIEGDNIFYNNKTEDVRCEGRSTIYSDKGELTADTIEYLKEVDRGIAIGEIVFEDTIENRTIFSEDLFYRDSSEYFKASIKELRPILLQEVDGDTLYVCADTLISAKPNDSLSYLKAIDNVRIYKSDLQAVCDSLYYSSIDSTFTLFGAPLCWSDTTQFKGDTIQILLSDDKVSEIIASKNAFIITQNAGDYYDQIKGKYIHTYLDSNELSLMHIKGNAESIYMIKDSEEAYVGPNMTLCSHMTFFFEDNELDSIKFYTQPESKMTPMDKAKSEDLKLKGFVWEAQRRPLDAVGLRIPLPSSRKAPSLDGEDEEDGEDEDEELDEFESDVLDIIEKGAKDPEVIENLEGSEVLFESGKILEDIYIDRVVKPSSVPEEESSSSGGKVPEEKNLKEKKKN